MSKREFTPVTNINRKLRKPYTKLIPSKIAMVYKNLKFNIPESMHLSECVYENNERTLRLDAIKGDGEFFEIDYVDPKYTSKEDIEDLIVEIHENTREGKMTVCLTTSFGYIIYYSINADGKILYLIDAMDEHYKGEAYFGEDIDSYIDNMEILFAKMEPYGQFKLPHRTLVNLNDEEIRINEDITFDMPKGYSRHRLPSFEGLDLLEIFQQSDDDSIKQEHDYQFSNQIRILEHSFGGMTSQALKSIITDPLFVNEDGRTTMEILIGVLKSAIEDDNSLTKPEYYSHNKLDFIMFKKLNSSLTQTIIVHGPSFIYNIEISFRDQDNKKKLLPIVEEWLRTIKPVTSKRS